VVLVEVAVLLLSARLVPLAPQIKDVLVATEQPTTVQVLAVVVLVGLAEITQVQTLRDQVALVFLRQ
jgi:hypothetical protein